MCWREVKRSLFPSDTLIYGISRNGSKDYNIRTCEHMTRGQLRIWARATINVALVTHTLHPTLRKFWSWPNQFSCALNDLSNVLILRGAWTRRVKLIGKSKFTTSAMQMQPLQPLQPLLPAAQSEIGQLHKRSFSGINRFGAWTLLQYKLYLLWFSILWNI